MDMPTSRAERQRGERLTSGAQRFARKPGLVARLVAPGFAKVLDRIDAALISGALHATLPDGSRRILGGRSPGFECDVDLRSWNALGFPCSEEGKTNSISVADMNGDGYLDIMFGNAYQQSQLLINIGDGVSYKEQEEDWHHAV